MPAKPMIQIARKFSLESIGRKYENIEVVAKGHNIAECITQLEEAFRTYTEAIVAGTVH
jgi:hypothetical protein